MPTASDPYGPVMAQLLRPQADVEFATDRPHRHAPPALRELSLKTAFGHARVIDREMAMCCLAGLWLYHGFLDESHALSQGIPSAAGSYWHGIMHRREGDFSNAKYWFRQATDRAMLEHIGHHIRSGLSAPSDVPASFDYQSTWQPSQLVDLCQRASGGNASLRQAAAMLSRLEWHGLFDFCYHRAVAPREISAHEAT